MLFLWKNMNCAFPLIFRFNSSSIWHHVFYSFVGVETFVLLNNSSWFRFSICLGFFSQHDSFLLVKSIRTEAIRIPIYTTQTKSDMTRSINKISKCGMWFRFLVIVVGWERILYVETHTLNSIKKTYGFCV